jgi:hypothetical protein
MPGPMSSWPTLTGHSTRAVVNRIMAGQTRARLCGDKMLQNANILLKAAQSIGFFCCKSVGIAECLV